MRGILATVVFVALFKSSAGVGFECQYVTWFLAMEQDGLECCNTPDVFRPDKMEEVFPKCEKMYNDVDSGCIHECVFLEEGLLTPQNTLDSEAITKYFTSPDKVLGPLVAASVQKCLRTYLTDDHFINVRTYPSACKSRAVIFHYCLDREVFVKCPLSMWTQTPKCERLKTKTNMCNIPVVFREENRE